MNLHQMRDHLNKKITHFINFLLVFPAAVLLQEGLGEEKGLVTHLNESELIINYHSVFFQRSFFARSLICFLVTVPRRLCGARHMAAR